MLPRLPEGHDVYFRAAAEGDDEQRERVAWRLQYEFEHRPPADAT
jgi:hypothetical protein